MNLKDNRKLEKATFRQMRDRETETERQTDRQTDRESQSERERHTYSQWGSRCQENGFERERASTRKT